MNRKTIFSVVVAMVALCGGLRAQNTRISPGSKVYIAPMNGFEEFLTAALEKKQVPVVIVTDKAQATFEISGNSDSQKAGWAKILFTGKTGSHEEASINVTDIKTGVVVFGYAVNKDSSVHGRQSAAEACAKHLKGKILSGR